MHLFGAIAQALAPVRASPILTAANQKQFGRDFARDAETRGKMGDDK
jgi:hypothetical protein